MKTLSLKKETQNFFLCLIITNILVALVSLVVYDLRLAANLIFGAFFLTFNLLFYALMSAAILVKKNIAWIGPVIVIKYLFLIISVYFIWAFCKALFVIAGFFAGLGLFILVYWLMQKWLRRRDNQNGSL